MRPDHSFRMDAAFWQKWPVGCMMLIFLVMLSACSPAPSATFDPRWPTMTALFAERITSGVVVEAESSQTPVPATPLSKPGVVETLDLMETPDLVETSDALPTPTASPAPTQPPQSLWVDPNLPAAFRQQIVLPAEMQRVDKAEDATLRLSIDSTNGDAAPVSRWVYALVAPFPTIPDGVTAEELHAAWKGVSPQSFAVPLMMDAETQAVLTAFWGAPAAQAVQLFPAERLVEAASNQKLAWAIVPFEALQPRWKVLTIDGQSPLHKDFDLAAYPLAVPFSASGELPPGVTAPAANRDPDLMTVVAMTGVTAMVRATAWTMDAKGILYPAQDIRDWLRLADLTHVSNEIAFDPECPLPNPAQTELVFCSNPSYIALLEDIGVDVVELSGDHFIDRDADAMRYTIELYQTEGWKYYGGGLNLDEGLSPALFEHNGNKIAFIGCNAKGGGYAKASATEPGAAECDFPRLYSQVETLKQQGYLVIATMQHQEYYTYKVKPEYRQDFTGFVNAGAVIVQGSQAHQPQNFEFYGDGLIHYGLGNLFFDQIKEIDSGGDHIAQRAFIDRHIFYNGRYLSTELLTIRFVDMARSRPMTPDERAEFLRVIFKASGW